MKLLEKLKKNTAVASGKVFRGVLDNLAEYYTMLVLFVALPAVVAHLTAVSWGLLLSFMIQAIVGILYIRGRK